MKKLYALFIILILVYGGINLSNDGLENINNLTNLDGALSIFSNQNHSVEGIVIGENYFNKISNFTDMKINDSAVSLVNSNNNIQINLTQIEYIENLEDYVINKLYDNASITSNQTLDLNGTITYFLYEEGSESYNANIYFNKNNQTFLISGHGISYENSDEFINPSKEIISSLNIMENNGLKRFWWKLNHGFCNKKL